MQIIPLLHAPSTAMPLERKDYLHWHLHTRGLMDTGRMALESSSTNGITKIIDQILDTPIGRKDGVAAKNMMKMHHLVFVDGMSHTMTASLYIRCRLYFLFSIIPH
ncbi:hypothetical protein J1N35_025777 [Gossypium stocksii]|uniref:Uncharacterized protein n=1 Tax=Gossypium stocksii TaxID=47602 RepID=A0A9D3V789_9ROSI|nr:hypothetical protein J1N35_025777 [Gossypium stocksii]